MNKLKLLIAIFLFNLVSLPLQAQESFKSMITISSDTVNLVVKTDSISSGFPYPHASMWGGDEGDMPKTVITNINLRYAKEKITVPLSAFSDLGDPYRIALQKDYKGFSIHINGGSTAGAYSALLMFENGLIKQRRVVNAAFPKEVWEETEYSFNTLDN